MNKQYWIIDTDVKGESLNTCEALGPYPTKKAAEKAVLTDIRNNWDDACACLKSDSEHGWCKPIHIVEVVRTVIPNITAKIELIDA